MGAEARVSHGLARLTARRYRRILTASLATLVTSATLLGFIGWLHGRGREAVRSDTRISVAQTGRQLLRTLQSRRGTLTFLRDTLNRRPTLTAEPLQALGASAVDHTRHLLAVGMLTPDRMLSWWTGPRTLSARQQTQLAKAVGQRMALPRAWRVPGTLVVTTDGPRALLVMIEPLKRGGAIVGAFDVRPLCEDFFASTLSPQYAVQLASGEAVLYQSPGWEAPADEGTVILEHPVTLDAARWTVRMRPPSTQVAQTLSWLNVSVIVLCVLAGFGIVFIIWLLAARTWLLQRAVMRRTAALRQALRRVRQLAITDELTGLYNRRFFLKRWEWECDRAKRYQRPLACMMVDVNGFKQVNDRLGHHTGDLVLKQVARELKTLLRHSDILARLGGDEFVVGLPETNPPQAAAVADKLRQVRIPITGHAPRGLGPVTLSVGLSIPAQAGDTPQQLLEAADRSLYDEKRRRSSPV